MAKKTNAARKLDQLKISYSLHHYAVEKEERGAIAVAEKTGQPIEQIFKTLVLSGDKTGVIVAVIRGDREVHLKALAKASGNKKVEMVPLKEVLGITGYVRGGCSPIGMKKNFPVFIDEEAFEHAQIFISAGLRGTQICLSAEGLMQATNGRRASVVEA